MLRMIYVVDGFRRDAVARNQSDADSASWSVPEDGSCLAERTGTTGATAAETEALRLTLGLATDTEEPVLSRLVRIAPGGVGRPWGDGDGWVALHVLGGVEGPAAGGLSVLRPTSRSDRGEPGWELTLHLPVAIDRLFVFRRSLACAWSVGSTDRAGLLARTFLVPDPTS